MIEDIPMTRRKFSQIVEEIHSKNPISRLDAVLKACEHHNIEPSHASKFISKELKENLETEARNLRLVK